MTAADYTPAELEACLAVFDSNVPEYFTPEERDAFEAFLRELPGPYLVLRDESAGVVACGGYATEPGSTTADFCWGMVIRKRHGQGIGRHLAQARLARIRREGSARAVALRTIPATRGFYERLGFVTERVIPDDIARGVDRCEMLLELTEDS